MTSPKPKSKAGPAKQEPAAPPRSVKNEAAAKPQAKPDAKPRPAKVEALPEPALTHPEIRAIVLGIMLAMFLGALDQTIVATALPTIGRHFGNIDDLSWVVTAYLLTGTAVTPLYGKLSDIHGRRVLMLAAIGIFVLGSVACALAPSMTALVLARGVQGLGGGGLMALAQTIIADIVSPRERGRYQGYIGAVFATSSVGGPVLGGFLTEHLDWSLIFWINLPLGLIALGMTSSVLRRVPFHPRKHRLDIIGALLMMSAAIALLLALSWGGRRYEWISPQIGALLLSSAILWGLFAWRLVTTREPFLPLTVLGNPVVRCATLAGACNMGTLVGMTIFVPLYFEVVLHLSASQSGLALIPLMAATVTFSTITGRLMTHVVHYKRMSLIGLSHFHFVARAAGDLAGVDADRAGAAAAADHRRRPRHRVSGVDRVHAERGVALADGHRHRCRQFLPRAVLGAGGGGAGRDRAGRTWRRRRHVGGDAGAHGVGARARLCVPLRVPRLRAGALVRHGVPDLDGGAAAQGPLGAITGRDRTDRAGNADPGGVGTSVQARRQHKAECAPDQKDGDGQQHGKNGDPRVALAGFGDEVSGREQQEEAGEDDAGAVINLAPQRYRFPAIHGRIARMPPGTVRTDH